MEKQERQDALRDLISGAGASVDSSGLREIAENDPELILEELILTRQAYETWRSNGQAMHRALLELWHRAEPEDTSHLTFGDDPQVVVDAVLRALAPKS